MTFLGNYVTNFSEEVWENIKSYSDFIKYLVNKYCSDGSYIYDDGDCKRGYFSYKNKMYMIRTWTINDTPKGAIVEYSIYKDNMTVEEAIKFRDEPLYIYKKDDTVSVEKKCVKKVVTK